MAKGRSLAQSSESLNFARKGDNEDEGEMGGIQNKIRSISGEKTENPQSLINDVIRIKSFFFGGVFERSSVAVKFELFQNMCLAPRLNADSQLDRRPEMRV